MNITKSIAFGYVLFLTVFLLSSSAALSAQPSKLKCEHLVEPIGIDNPTPRLSWLMEDS